MLVAVHRRSWLLRRANKLPTTNMYTTWVPVCCWSLWASGPCADDQYVEYFAHVAIAGMSTDSQRARALHFCTQDGPFGEQKNKRNESTRNMFLWRHDPWDAAAGGRKFFFLGLGAGSMTCVLRANICE